MPRLGNLLFKRGLGSFDRRLQRWRELVRRRTIRRCDGLGCINLEGGFKEYAFHPLLKQDIILTQEEYPEGEEGVVQRVEKYDASASAEELGAPDSAPASASASASASSVASPPPAQKKKISTVQGIRFKKDGMEVYAYPEDGRVPALSYILYRWDDSFHRKAPDASSTIVGRTGAKKDGSISKVGLTWTI